MNTTTDIFIKELAIAVGINMIASTVSKCEFRTYQLGQPVRGEEYYLWNIEPNQNQNSSDFIQQFITQLCYENEALIVELNGRLYVADHFTRQQFALKEDTFSNITIKTLSLNKVFSAHEVIYMQLNDKNIKYYLDGSYTQYGKTIAHAMRSYMRSNMQKGVLEIDAALQQRPEFQKELQELIDNRFRPYFDAESAVLPLTKGYKYTDTSSQMSASNSTPADISERINYEFEISGRAFKIPKALMMGDISDVQQITKNFLTFCIDPMTDKAGEEITRKRYGAEQFAKGNYMEINTNAIQHVDVFDMATNADKLLSSGIYCIDELRTKLGDVPLDTEWSKKHYITKNYAEASQLKHLEGGE
nr:phage portal protein [Diplocloster modestus]